MWRHATPRALRRTLSWCCVQDDKITEVIAAHERCMVILSDHHLAVLASRRLSLKQGPSPRWCVPLTEIQSVRGACTAVMCLHMESAAAVQCMGLSLPQL